MKFGNIQAVGQVVSTGSVIITGSAQVVYSGLTGIPSGIVSGSGQIPSLLPSGVVSGSAQVDVLSTTNIARLATTGSNTFQGLQTVNGSLVVTGSLTAQQFIVSSSVTYLTESFASGSHKFGDSSDDIHQFTGSLNVSGSLVTTGNVGLGITPTTTLHLAGDITQQTSLNISAQFWIVTRKSRGTVTSPTTVLVNDEAGGIQFTGYDGAAWRAGAAIRAKIESVSLGSLSSNLEFFAGDGAPSTGTQVMAMRGDTKFVGINTTAPNARLDVNGKTIVSGSLTTTGTKSGLSIPNNLFAQQFLLMGA